VRIAYLINQYPSISHSFIRREIHALEQLGFEILRISLRGWDLELVDEQDRIERKHTRYVLRAHPLTLLFAVARMLLAQPVRLLQALRIAWHMSHTSARPLHVHLAYLAEACRIEPWLRTEGIKHLHAHFGTNSAEVAMLVHVLGGPKWSFTVHGPEEFDKAPLIGLVEKLRRCAFVVAVSSFGRSQLFRLLDHNYWPKVHVVHCGLNRAFYDVPASRPSAVHRLVCVGRLCEQKGQLLLVEAARFLAKEGCEFDLVLAGDGEMRGEIELLLKQYDLSDRVRITGWISNAQVREEIIAARAMVLPSFAEGLPVVLMEAMALRRPVISTYIAGIPELIRDGEHGWLVPASDAVALANAMRACLEAPPDVIVRLGEAARERVLALHDVENEAIKLQRLFDRDEAP
jgi:glycosyltransferase involved in cell wall biosynthesis